MDSSDAAGLPHSEIEALTKRTQEGGTEVVQAKAGKVRRLPNSDSMFPAMCKYSVSIVELCRAPPHCPWHMPALCSLTLACEASMGSRT